MLVIWIVLLTNNVLCPTVSRHFSDRQFADWGNRA